MRANDEIYVTAMSVSVAVAQGNGDCLCARQLATPRTARMVILSADAPEWAMVTLAPPRTEQDAGIGL